jgi:hypothetical protein
MDEMAILHGYESVFAGEFFIEETEVDWALGEGIGFWLESEPACSVG